MGGKGADRARLRVMAKLLLGLLAVSGLLARQSWLAGFFFPGLCLSFSVFYVFLFPIKSSLSHFLHEKQGSFREMNSFSSRRDLVCTEK